MPLAENSKELEWIRRYRLIDDTFMRVVFMNPQCTELLIRCILQNHDLKVLKVESQKELKNLHDARLYWIYLQLILRGSITI